MEQATMDVMGVALGKVGAALALALSAVGSSLGIGAAGQAAVGAWKKCYAQNKPAPFVQLVVCVGAPITQTFYGLIVMTVRLLPMSAVPANWPATIAW